MSSKFFTNSEGNTLFKKKEYIGHVQKIINNYKGMLFYIDDNNMEQSIIFYGLKVSKNKKRPSKLNIDDEVVFNIETSINRHGDPYSYANIIRFIENKTLDKLIQEYFPEKEYYGFFKSNERNLWIEEANTHLRFYIDPLYPRFLTPEDNTLVAFHLRIKKNGNTKAFLIEPLPNPEYEKFREKEIQTAIITEITEKYIVVKLKDFSFTGLVHYYGKCPYIVGEEIEALYAGINKFGSISFKTIL